MGLMPRRPLLLQKAGRVYKMQLPRGRTIQTPHHILAYSLTWTTEIHILLKKPVQEGQGFFFVFCFLEGQFYCCQSTGKKNWNPEKWGIRLDGPVTGSIYCTLGSKNAAFHTALGWPDTIFTAHPLEPISTQPAIWDHMSPPIQERPISVCKLLFQVRNGWAPHPLSLNESWTERGLKSLTHITLL